MPQSDGRRRLRGRRPLHRPRQLQAHQRQLRPRRGGRAPLRHRRPPPGSGPRGGRRCPPGQRRVPRPARRHRGNRRRRATRSTPARPPKSWKKIRRTLRAPFVVSDIEIYVSASIGVSLCPFDAADGETLLKHADAAMYRAKDAGRDCHALYAVDKDDALAQLSMAGRLRSAIERGEELVLHYQPLVELRTGSIVGRRRSSAGRTEGGSCRPWTSSRWPSGPASWAPSPDWVIGEACRQGKVWRDRRLDLYVSINLPPSFCSRPRCGILATIESFGLNPDRLMIEITESAMMVESRANMGHHRGAPRARVAPRHRRLRERALLAFAPQPDARLRPEDRPLLRAGPARGRKRGRPGDLDHQLARNLGLDPLAEGIETDEQRAFFLEHGCELGQGFRFSRPVKPSELETLCRASRIAESAA